MKPVDVPGQCNAYLYLADDQGGNTDTLCTIRCGLPASHTGWHVEEFEHGNNKPIIITWLIDERHYETPYSYRYEDENEIPIQPR